jgi:hypothetical protein
MERPGSVPDDGGVMWYLGVSQFRVECAKWNIMTGASNHH